MKKSLILACAVAGFATVTLAHQGVQNPAVKARMHAMMAIGQNTKILGSMAKGATGFDAAVARAAASEIAAHAAQSKKLFADRQDDPKSEAKPVIWENYGDFTAKLDALIAASARINQVASEDELIAVVGAIGATCKDCHQTYRE